MKYALKVELSVSLSQAPKDLFSETKKGALKVPLFAAFRSSETRIFRNKERCAERLNFSGAFWSIGLGSVVCAGIYYLVTSTQVQVRPGLVFGQQRSLPPPRTCCCLNSLFTDFDLGSIQPALQLFYMSNTIPRHVRHREPTIWTLVILTLNISASSEIKTYLLYSPKLIDWLITHTIYILTYYYHLCLCNDEGWVEY